MNANVVQGLRDPTGALVARDVLRILTRMWWEMLPVNLVPIMRIPAQAATRRKNVCVILVSLGQAAGSALFVLQENTLSRLEAVLLVQEERIRHSGAPHPEMCASLVLTNLTRLREIQLSSIARVLPVILAQIEHRVSLVLLESTSRLREAQTVVCARQASIQTTREQTLLGVRRSAQPMPLPQWAAPLWMLVCAILVSLEMVWLCVCKESLSC